MKLFNDSLTIKQTTFILGLLSLTIPTSWGGQFDHVHHPETNEDWIRLSVQNPKKVMEEGANEREKIFLRNTHHGLVTVFDPWFENKPGFEHMTFEEMIRSQHVTTKFGRDGKAYYGFTPAAHGLPETREDSPGMMRSEIRQTLQNGEKVGLGAISIPLRINKKIDEPSDRLKAHIERYKNQTSENKMFEESDEDFEVKFQGTTHSKGLATFLLADPENKVALINIQTGQPILNPATGEPIEYLLPRKGYGRNFNLDVQKMPGIEISTPPYNQIYEHYMNHSYPHPQTQRVFVDQMGRLMNELKVLSQTSQKPYSHDVRARALDLIEQYLYLGDHAHLFQSINHSILMTQLNSVLIRFGFNGIGPSNIDYVALAEQFPEWRRSFRSKLSETNPDIHTFGETNPENPNLSIHAHIEDFGNCYFYEGQPICHPNRSLPAKKIEGLTAYSSLPPQVELEYKAYVQGAGDTGWQKAGTYVGTVGERRALFGVAFRLVHKNGGAPPFHVHYTARMGSSNWTPVHSDGQHLGTREMNQPMTELQVWVSRNPEETATDCGEKAQLPEKATSPKQNKNATQPLIFRSLSDSNILTSSQSAK